jgi:hypothetical protein
MQRDGTRFSQVRRGLRLGLLVGLPLAAAAVGCHSSTGPDISPDVGVIEHYGDGPAGLIDAPAVVRAGQDFTVTVRTFGGGCVSAAGASVTYHRPPALDLAVVVPYDNTRVPAGVACTSDLRRAPRDVTLRFTTPGAATIRVEGRREPGGGRAALEVPVTVTPR